MANLKSIGRKIKKMVIAQNNINQNTVSRVWHISHQFSVLLIFTVKIRLDI